MGVQTGSLLKSCLNVRCDDSESGFEFLKPKKSFLLQAEKQKLETFEKVTSKRKGL